MDRDVIGAEVQVAVIAGKDLVAKDRSGMFGMGKATSSDPYVRIKYQGLELGKCAFSSFSVPSGTPKRTMQQQHSH